MSSDAGAEYPLPAESVAAVVLDTTGPLERTERLAGDASTRRFYRLKLARGGSLVAMALEGPLESDAHPQIAVGRYLESIGFPIPRLHAVFPEHGLLLYEDLGDLLLQDLALPAFAAAAYDDVAALYGRAVDLISTLQGIGTERLPSGHPAAIRCLDPERFSFELNFFREHYVERLRGLQLSPGESGDLEELIGRLAARASRPPYVLCHRDYHSRNLLVHEGRIRVVDFQDARLGPAGYDLASLLRDSYVTLPHGLGSSLIERYLESAPEPRDAVQFRAHFELVALQRNLKAIGTFAFQAVAMGRSGFLDSIPPTWDHVFEALPRIPDLVDTTPLLRRLAAP